MALACLALAALASCSRQTTISPVELKSKLLSAASVAAETSTFIEYVRQKRATQHYATGHLEYLSSQLADIAREFHEALPPAGAERQFTDGRQQVDALAAELNELAGGIAHLDQLSAEQDHLSAIHKRLQQVISSL